MALNKKVDLDAEAFVALMYNVVLGREPDPSGFNVHLARLRSGEVSYEKLALEFLKSHEYSGKTDLASSYGYREQDLSIFNLFHTDLVKPQQGFLTDFIGSRTRISSLWKGCEAFDGTIFPLPIPGDYHADATEWIGTLKGVLAATERFAVMELGAGYGPWIAASAKAAELRGISAIILCGVEADPGRFALLCQNIEDNQLTSYEVTLVQGAVGIAAGKARWPRIVDPPNDAGARPLRCCSPNCSDLEADVADVAYLAGLLDDMIDIEIVSLEKLLSLQSLWDLIHIDIQGTEVELCRAFVDQLSAQVRYMVIGTHSRKIEGDLIDLLLRAGWDLEHEKPVRFSFRRGEPSLERMTTHDGTQVWRNPRL